MKPYHFLLLLSMLCGIAACDEPTSIGSDLVGEDLFDFEVADTFTVKLLPASRDSLPTAPSRISIGGSEINRPYLLGNINDPVFGKAQASIYTEIQLASNDLQLSTQNDLQLDSLVLTLAYSLRTPYGDMDEPLSLNVYEVTENIQANTFYYNDPQFAFNPIPIGQSQNITFNTDSVVINTQDFNDDNEKVDTSFTLAPQLRIRLDDALGLALLGQSGTTTFQNNENFQQFFRGLYIAPAQQGDAIAYFNLLSGNSALTLYYTRDTLACQAVVFPISNTIAIVNNYTIDQSGTVVANTATTVEQETAYLQAISGTGIDLAFPHIANLQDIAINKAELEFFILPNTTDTYIMPDGFTLIKEASEINPALTIFSQHTTDDTLMVDGQQVFRHSVGISNTIQDLIDNATNEEIFHLDIALSFMRTERAIIGGPQHPDFPMKLRIHYTHLE